MPQKTSVDERLSALEQDVAQLKRQIESSSGKKNWIKQITGSFKDDPEFAEVVRLGKEIRDAEGPEP